ncbi:MULTISPECIES: Kelch repeat-containing protein [Antarcticibacterium]|nr:MULTISPECIES: hypothetical protein [Antarcticibacterium]
MRPIFLLLFFVIHSFTFSQEISWRELEAEGEPLARHENALIEAGGKLILIGGRGEKPINIYDPGTKTWSKGAIPPFEIHHMQAVNLDGLIYILGAFTGAWPNETPLTHVLIYDVSTDTWAIGPEVPANRRRGAAGVVVYNKKVYMVNGIINGHSSGWVNWLDEYDPYSGQWKTLASSPRSRDHFQAAVIESKLYVAGGRRSGSAESGFAGTVGPTNVYDFNSNTWEELPNIPTPRAGTAAAVMNGIYVVIGGESDTQENSHSEVEAFDPVSRKWSSLPVLGTGRHGTQAVNAGEAIIIGSGSSNRGGGPELTSFEVLTAKATAQFELPTFKKEGLRVSAKEIDFRKDPGPKELLITNPGQTAVIMPYLQHDNQEDFMMREVPGSPIIIAPGATRKISIERVGKRKNASATIFIKTTGNSAPVEIKLSA